MKGKGRGNGPVALLAPGFTWLDRQVKFEVPRGESMSIEAACRGIWEISKTIRARRGELRMSQVELADSAGIRRQTVADIETGARWPDASSLARVCSVLGLELRAVDRSQQA